MSGEQALRERAGLLDELRDIVQAMKNAAFAELQRVERHRPGLTEARDALEQAMARLPRARDHGGTCRRDAGPARAAWLVIGADRGFCGPFNAHLANEMAQIRQATPRATLLIASRRLLDLAGADAGHVVGLPGCSTVEDSVDALSAWLEAITPFLVRPGGEVWMLHAGAHGLQRTRLGGPPQAGDAAATPSGRSEGRDPPLHQLPLPALREALERQALGLALRCALHESLAQENHWRLTQMQLAQDHLDELGRTLRRRRSALRQAEITNELETLVSALPGRATRDPGRPG